MLECCIYVITNPSPQSHITWIIGLRRLGFVIVPPVLIAAEKEGAIIVAPDEHRIDALQPFRETESGQGLGIAGIECVYRESIVFVAFIQKKTDTCI